jgi:hypothetical protein
MKRTLAVATAAAAALVSAGIAVAHGVDGGKSAKAVTGTFTATTASRITTRTCTTSDNKTLVTTEGTYTGAATGDADLTGPATLHARSIINSTDNIGVVSGSLRIDVPDRDTTAQFTAVYSGGQIGGLAVGHAHSPNAQLVANLSAGFSATGGFTSGKLGGAAGGAAVELTPAGCQSTRTTQERSEARGTVSAVSSTSITVAGLTCTVPTNLQAKLNGITVNSRAEIHCQLVNGTNTLTSAEQRK